MSQPDLPRRVDRTEQELTAISDTVVEIKETVDEHTATLANTAASPPRSSGLSVSTARP